MTSIQIIIHEKLNAIQCFCGFVGIIIHEKSNAIQCFCGYFNRLEVGALWDDLLKWYEECFEFLVEQKEELF